MITIYEPDPDAVDMEEWELQLNNYRLMIEACGFPVSRMIIQATVRDGNTVVAHNRGVMKNIYLIPVQRLNDTEVSYYFERKRRELLEALKAGIMPAPCSEKESWEGKRCKSYCPVAEFCGVKIEEVGDE
jgi:hypothetical protein